MDTKLQPNKAIILFYLFGFVLLILTVITIPTYFIFKYEFDKNYTKKYTQLQNYSLRVKEEFNENQKFKLPRSLLYFTALYDNQNRLLEATTQHLFPKNLNQIQFNGNGYFFYKLRLNNDTVLVAATNNGKKIIYFKMVLTILGLFVFLLLSTWVLMKMVTSPYEKINHYLDSFFNDAMHELKTPIGVIQFNLELLEEKEPGKKEVKRAMNGVKGLQFIYEDIEYLIKHKNIIYNSSNIDFSSTLFHRIDFFNSLAKSKKISIIAKIQEHLYIIMNKIELQRVIDNTISNAIKYSRSNSKIFIKLYAIEDEIVFSVEDFGKGIENTDTIFQRYHRQDQDKGGFGIGLNIVKTICDKNNIVIDVHTQPKLGSTFTYRFKKPSEVF